MKVHLIYFSPALSTRKIMRAIGKSIDAPVEELDVTMGLDEALSIDEGDLAVFGVPVYAGRVPKLATEAFRKIKGNNTPAVIVNVYGNRDYDDALLELRNICQENGFVPIAAGAFIARHSIFPKVAINRPDEEDEEMIAGFAKKCYDKYLEKEEPKPLNVKGNYPYREHGPIPLVPKGNSSCDKCGTCVRLCPVGAIPADHPRKTNKELCISCARCITVCPQQSRNFRGLVYGVVRRKFESKCATRRENETFFS
ncbi:MAG: 4Fe-4S binding protein [Dysgonomonas sp.]